MSPWVFLLAHVSFPSAGALPDLRIALAGSIVPIHTRPTRYGGLAPVSPGATGSNGTTSQISVPLKGTGAGKGLKSTLRVHPTAHWPLRTGKACTYR